MEQKIIVDKPSLLAAVNRYYSEKIVTCGATPAGVDWNSKESQELRFSQLMRIANTQPFSINDIGCGFGSLIDYLESIGARYEYYGIDVSDAMIKQGMTLHGSRQNCTFHVSAECEHIADYSVASGIFNVKLEADDNMWLAYLLEMLEKINRVSRRGFSFNCLTKYSDPAYMQKRLFYGDPCLLFDYCKCKFSPQVALLHDYGLYEFTILVRK
jgi:SAM-dependent methyltransferase